MLYDDGRIRVDDTHLHIRSLCRDRRVAVRDIVEVTTFDLSRSGSRLRLVGIGFERPRSWFTWDPRRRSKQSAIEFDIGRWCRISLTPDEPRSLLSILEHHPERESKH